MESLDDQIRQLRVEVAESEKRFKDIGGKAVTAHKIYKEKVAELESALTLKGRIN